MLTPEEAQRELAEAEARNPGPWIAHSRSVGENARLIAARVPGMDPDTAYVMGLMHDIGRREGVTGALHIFDGHDYMQRLGQPEIARICLTHTFPIRDAYTFYGRNDCPPERLAELHAWLQETPFDEYDLLIQLCDAISLPNGACIMEKRLVDVTLRHGWRPFTMDKWRAFMQLKKHFDERCGTSIYDLLPRVMENSSVNLV